MTSYVTCHRLVESLKTSPELILLYPKAGFLYFWVKDMHHIIHFSILFSSFLYLWEECSEFERKFIGLTRSHAKLLNAEKKLKTCSLLLSIAKNLNEASSHSEFLNHFKNHKRNSRKISKKALKREWGSIVEDLVEGLFFTHNSQIFNLVVNTEKNLCSLDPRHPYATKIYGYIENQATYNKKQNYPNWIARIYYDQEK